MSCYLVKSSLIAEIVNAATIPHFNITQIKNPRTCKVDVYDSVSMARTLAQANLDSLADRYGDNPVNDDFINACTEKVIPNTYLKKAYTRGSLLQQFKNCRTLEHQCASSDAWWSSDASYLLYEIKKQFFLQLTKNYEFRKANPILITESFLKS